MRKQLLILIYAIIGYCFSQSNTDECTKKFEDLQGKKCRAIHSTCNFTDHTPNKCISIQNNDCSIGNGDPDICAKTVHKLFPQKKCVYDSDTKKCNVEDTVCEDYNYPPQKINGVYLREEDCSKLKADDDKQYCGLSNENPPKCKSYYKLCEDITIPTGSTTFLPCTNNFPKNKDEICYINQGNCKPTQRKCNIAIYNVKKDECHKLVSSNTTKQKCFYDDYYKTCSEKIISCNDYSLSICEYVKPLINNGNIYDEKFKCKKVGQGANEKCDKEWIACEDYQGSDDSICPDLKVKDQSLNKCIYYPHIIKVNGVYVNRICKEIYNTCTDYNNTEIEKNRLDCEIIKPPNSNEKCVYIPEKDICEKRDIYSNCDDYKGSDKKICESIISPNTNSYCVLEKDSKCKERPLLCHEAFNRDDCLYIAKSSDNNKKCSFLVTNTITGDGVCYEEYIRCEDYLENSTINICGSIKLYDGKKCISESGRCLTKDKECKDAKTKEECELIAQTGVSDPEKKVCQYNSNGCEENYKYCSDYRGDDPTICKEIKPYDESGNNIDITSKCTLRETDVGCQRVPKECSDAGENPILCALISPKIQDNKLKYCAYLPTNLPSPSPHYKCEEHFKTCDDFQLPSEIDCEHTIPENYLTNICHMKDGKCIQITDCTNFTIADEEILCRQLDYNCEYISGTCVTEEKTCKNIKFYAIHDENKNEEICKSKEASKIYKSCVLKEDLSGCEEKYNNSIYENININTNTETEGNSSGFITRGNELIIIILFLLI